MNSEKKDNIHETLQFFLNHAPTIKQLFNEDVDIAIADREKVLEHLQSSELIVESSKGRILNSHEPMSIAIRSNSRIATDFSEEDYGTPFTAVLVPIHDKNGEVIGGISVSKSTNKQTKLMEVAEQFATSSEEIAASTEELSVSASDFSEYMKQLANAQSDMRRQVEATTTILEIINAIAKNTRVLGFNAGIESARSGDYGRGFSVVAKEITRLADQTADSVNEINQLLVELNNKVENVASVIENTIQISSNQTKVIEEISQAIQRLTDGAEKIEEMAKEV